MFRTLVVAFLALGIGVLGTSTAVAQQGGDVIVVPNDHGGKFGEPSVDVGAVSPGAPGGTGLRNAGTSGSSGRSGPVCSYEPAAASSSKLETLYPDNRLPSDTGIAVSDVAYYDRGQ